MKLLDDSTTPSGDEPTVWAPIPTDLGVAWIEWIGATVTRLGLPGTPAPPGPPTPVSARFAPLASGLRRYFGGVGPLPKVEAIGGVDGSTRLRRRIYEVVSEIPRGSTMTYSEVAAVAGRSGAARAVGAAMAENRFAPIIPCHRVLGSDGGLRGYAGGLAMKRHLLDMESSDA